ncbi:MAG: Hint domain-containing protein [Rhodobacteraceae bacterium]|nr:Hint domain-containing protein [Paracoccaceae bacterium]
MGWIGIADRDEGRFSTRGFGEDIGFRRIGSEDVLLTRGSFVLETRMSPDSGPQELFSFERSYPWERAFSLKAIPGGGIFLIHKHGHSITHAAIQISSNDRTDVIRISYVWDSIEGWARLGLERPDESGVVIRDIEAPRPFLLADWREAMLGRGRTMAMDVQFAALSTRVEPIGPMPTLCSPSPILTPEGYKPISAMNFGDQVVTAPSETVTIGHRVARTVPARGSFAPIRLRAPYLGLVSDIVVSPYQKVILQGSDVEYIFGRESVLVAARHLMDGRVGRPEPCGALVTYHQLLTARHDVLTVGGTQLESLYIGRIRRDDEKFQSSLLAGYARNTLPEHGRRVSKEIKPFEAITLIDALAA